MERLSVRSAIKKYIPRAIRLTLLALALCLVITALGSVITVFFIDSTPPVIEGPEGDAYVHYIGDSIAYKKIVRVSDDRDGVALDVDKDAVDLTVEGSYTVKYTATDKAGNETDYKLRLMVKARKYSKDTLMQMIAEKADLLGMRKSMSKTELVRMIYDYVNSPKRGKDNANIRFSDESNTPNQAKQEGIRVDWEADWIEEAVRTLEMDRMKGDCYSYYSVSKAFFEYFGIENVGIQRSKGSGEAGTHFWSAVKVESGWYYYDATRLGGSFSDGSNNACLITEGKLGGYRTSSGGADFYYFKKPADFPKISTTPID